MLPPFGSVLGDGGFQLLSDFVELFEPLECADAVFKGFEAALLLEIAVYVPPRLEHGDVFALLPGGKLDQIIADCNKLGCKMIVVVPSMDLTVPATLDEIKADAVAVLKEMVKKTEPHGIKLSIEFCGCPTMSINRFEYAYDIVTEVNHPLVGITLDQYHFHAMASSFEALEKADGKKIFVWHLNGMENMPCGAAYNNDEKRLWPGEPGDCLDHKRYADTLKKIGFEGDVCTMEVFRPDYYKLSNEENIKKAAEVTRAHVAKYWGE